MKVSFEYFASIEFLFIKEKEKNFTEKSRTVIRLAENFIKSNLKACIYCKT